jgi:hypothetical protein
MALGAPLVVVCRSVPDTDEPAGRSPRGPHRRCGRMSGNAPPFGFGVRRVLSALPGGAAAGIPAFPAPKPLGFPAVGRPQRLAPRSGGHAAPSDGDRWDQDARASPGQGNPEGHHGATRGSTLVGHDPLRRRPRRTVSPYRPPGRDRPRRDGPCGDQRRDPDHQRPSRPTGRAPPRLSPTGPRHQTTRLPASTPCRGARRGRAPWGPEPTQGHPASAVSTLGE